MGQNAETDGRGGRTRKRGELQSCWGIRRPQALPVVFASLECFSDELGCSMGCRVERVLDRCRVFGWPDVKTFEERG